jgi:hypothetical protein
MDTSFADDGVDETGSNMSMATTTIPSIFVTTGASAVSSTTPVADNTPTATIAWI